MDIERGRAWLEASEDALLVPNDALRGGKIGDLIEWQFDKSAYYPQFQVTVRQEDGEEFCISCWGGAFLHPGIETDSAAGDLGWDGFARMGLPTVRNGVIHSGFGLSGAVRLQPEENRDAQELADCRLEEVMREWIVHHVDIGIAEHPFRVWVAWDEAGARPEIVLSWDEPPDEKEWNRFTDRQTKFSMMPSTGFAQQVAEELGLLDKF